MQKFHEITEFYEVYQTEYLFDLFKYEQISFSWLLLEFSAAS
jgi:hypothetical protein